MWTKNALRSFTPFWGSWGDSASSHPLWDKLNTGISWQGHFPVPTVPYGGGTWQSYGYHHQVLTHNHKQISAVQPPSRLANPAQTLQRGAHMFLFRAALGCSFLQQAFRFVLLFNGILKRCWHPFLTYLLQSHCSLDNKNFIFPTLSSTQVKLLPCYISDTALLQSEACEVFLLLQGPGGQAMSIATPDSLWIKMKNTITRKCYFTIRFWELNSNYFHLCDPLKTKI